MISENNQFAAMPETAFSEAKAYEIAQKIKPLVDLLIDKEVEVDVADEAIPFPIYNSEDRIINYDEYDNAQHYASRLVNEYENIQSVLNELIDRESIIYDAKNR